MVAQDTGFAHATPITRCDWAGLARSLGVKVIHIAERDTQVADAPKRPGEFVNTWSIDGFVGEGSQPSELGWGTHERHFPEDARRHAFGCDAAVYLMRPGAATRVRSWTPRADPVSAFRHVGVSDPKTSRPLTSRLSASSSRRMSRSRRS